MPLIVLGLAGCSLNRYAPLDIRIADSLKQDCPAPDPRKVKGANQLAILTEIARLCEQAKRHAILSILETLAPKK